MSGDRLLRALIAQKQRVDVAQHAAQQQPQITARPPPQATPLSALTKQQRRASKRKRDDSQHSNESSRVPIAKPSLPVKEKAAAVAAPSLTASTPDQSKGSTQKRRRSDASRHSSTPSPSPSPMPTSSSKTAPPPPSSSSTSALSSKLSSARFRWLNEKLYSCQSDDALSYFTSNPNEFTAYHVGFRQQVEKWPQHPLILITQHLNTLPPHSTIADMGCGDAAIASTFHPHRHTVHSFDLLPSSPAVVSCNIAHTPLADGAVDVVVYCLSLMGLDWAQFIREGWRVLRVGGEAVVAEVASRMKGGGGPEGFVKALEAMGFKRKKVVQNDYFVCAWLIKVEHRGGRAEGQSGSRKGSKGKKGRTGTTQIPSQAETFVLAPCLYKKR